MRDAVDLSLIYYDDLSKMIASNSMRKFSIYLLLIILSSVAVSSQNKESQISESLKAFEKLVNRPIEEEQLSAFVETYINPADEKKERWINYMINTLKELDGADLGKPDAPGEFVRVYRPVGAAVGKMVITILFDKAFSFYIKKVIGNIEITPTFSEVKKNMSSEQMTELLESKLGQWSKNDKFSGAVLLAKDGLIIFNQAYGYASKRYEVQNETNTRFNLASAGKMFTGIAIARLKEKGLLSYNDRIADILPDYPNKEVAGKVTVHHLLTHTSGLGSFWNDKYHAQWSLLRNISDYVELFVNDELLFIPGEKTYYSNSGYIVLGIIIEKLTGENYFNFIRSNVFSPSMMEDTDAFELDRPVKRIATGYTHSSHLRNFDSGPMRNNNYQKLVKGNSAGGTYSTTTDMLKFINAIQQNQLVSSLTKKELLEGKVNLFTSKYGYGFFEYLDNKWISYGHGGGSQGVSTSVRFFPDLGYSFVVLSNYDNGGDNVSALLVQMITSTSAEN